MKLKVCGLTQISQIHELIKMRVDFLGFIFYEPSPRYVLNSIALKDIANAKHPAKVGVFVNESVKQLASIANTAKLHFVQLHGDENKAYLQELRNELDSNIHIAKTFRISEQETALQSQLNEFTPHVDYFLFDTDSKQYGGTGKRFDWQILNSLTLRKPYLLSGGISPQNRKELDKIDSKPFALDINSKFEKKPGIKDLNKIRKFYENL